MGTVADAFGAKLPGVRSSILSGRAGCEVPLGSNDKGFFAGARGVAVSLHPAKLALMRDAQNTSRHPYF